MTIDNHTENLEGFVPFPPEFVGRYRQAGYWQDRSIASVFDEVCERYAERTALIADGEQIKYRQVSRRAERLALHFLELGLRCGDYVVMQLPNVPEFVYVYLALQKIGVRPVMALPSHRFTEISHFVGLSRAVAYIVPERQGDFAFADLATQLEQTHDHLRLVFVAGEVSQAGHHCLYELLETRSQLSPQVLRQMRADIDPGTPALLLLSGGTTGVPKLIPRTHNDYIYNSRAAAALSDLHPADRLLVVLPIAHNFPLASFGLQGCLLHGACAVLSASTRSQDILRCIEQERITHLEVVPTLLIRLLNDPLLGHYDLSSLRVITVGGQKLPTEIKRRSEELLPGSKLQEIFGMAEGLLCLVRLDDPAEVRYETVGRPVSLGDELRLVDDEGRDVPAGEVGELLVRGPYTLRGYFRAAEYNARSFTSDGFYRTGDLMRRHPSGNYVVEGRKKDLINRGGEKISAEEVEELILAHPAIFNVSCVPIPDPVLGERMCACVILRTGEQAPTLPELCQFLSAKGVAKFKLPERLALFEDFPLTRIGKVSKPQLVAQVLAELGHETVERTLERIQTEALSRQEDSPTRS
ncbi:MAG TPA: AMP-binding protein [Ktedonobacteraceae bacterium]|jgi:2,3-dihydroxybenzoate-AMP ligase